MKTKFFLLVIIPIFLIGCSTRYIVNPANQEEVTGLHQLSQEDDAIVSLKNGKEINVQNILLGQDSTSMFNLETKKIVFYKTKEIESIHFIESWKGAIDGFEVGFLVGAFPGMITGLANDYFPQFVGVLVMGTMFGVTGGIIGAIIGAIEGSEEIYIIKR